NDQLEFGDSEDIGGETYGEQFKEDAKYLIDYFFENIMIRDYVGAYTLLGSDKQAGMSYTDFREKYIHTVDLEHSDLMEDKADETHANITTDVTIKSKLPDKDDIEEDVLTYSFTVGYENDQLRIMDITTEKD